MSEDDSDRERLDEDEDNDSGYGDGSDDLDEDNVSKFGVGPRPKNLKKHTSKLKMAPTLSPLLPLEDQLYGTNATHLRVYNNYCLADVTYTTDKKGVLHKTILHEGISDFHAAIASAKERIKDAKAKADAYEKKTDAAQAEATKKEAVAKKKETERKTAKEKVSSDAKRQKSNTGTPVAERAEAERAEAVEAAEAAATAAGTAEVAFRSAQKRYQDAKEVSEASRGQAANVERMERAMIMKLEAILKLLESKEDLEVTLKFPQLVQEGYAHTLDILHEGYEHHAGKLCMSGDEKDQFRPWRPEDGRKESHIEFKWTNQESTLKVFEGTEGPCMLSYSVAGCIETIPVSPHEVSNLLSPETWDYNFVRGCDGAVDQRDALLLEIGATDFSDPDQTAEVLRIVSGGRFVSRSVTTSKGVDIFEVKVCGANNIWESDKGGVAFGALTKDTQKRIALLHDDKELISKWLDTTLNATPDKLCALKNIVRSKQEEKISEVEMKEALTKEVFSILKRLNQGAQSVHANLRRARNSFERCVQNQSVDFDIQHPEHTCHNNGFMFDASIKAKRCIKKEDYTTLCINYPYPEFDAGMNTLLNQWWRRVMPEDGVADFRMYLYASALIADQSNPVVLFSFGQGGAMKGRLQTLINEAFGPYAKAIDPKMILESKSDAESCTPQKLTLKDKLVLFVDDIKNADVAELKRATGGQPMVGRGFQVGVPFSFVPTFKMIEISCNDLFTMKRDSGIERRVIAIKHSIQFKTYPTQELADKACNECEEDNTVYITNADQAEFTSLAPQVMARMRQIYATGTVVERPKAVEESTAELWAETAKENLLQDPMLRWYTHCKCTPKNGFEYDNTTKDLVECREDNTPCPHKVTLAEIKRHMKMRETTKDGKNLLSVVKSGSNKDAPIVEMLKKVKLENQLFLYVHDRVKDERQVIYGLVPKAEQVFTGPQFVTEKLA